MSRTILLAPHEDGLGASAWAARIARELLRRHDHPIAKIRILVSSEALEAFHRDKYGSAPVEIVRLEEVRRPLRLVKNQGGVDVAATVESALTGYAASHQEYDRATAARGILEDADLLVDIGVPQLTRLVTEENRQRLASGRRPLAAVTLQDHSWSLTLREMASAAGLLTEPVAAALRVLQDDEVRAPQTVLFPEPITPAIFQRHWRDVLGVSVLALPGVLGGPRWTERWAGEACPRTVRALLGIRDELPALFISGGGTSVWDDTLTALLDDYVAHPPRYHVVVFSPAEARRRGVRLAAQPAPCGSIECARHPACERLIFLGRVAGETHHPLFAAFDLVLTRAGGGTVNDAIAFRVPLMLIEEPGHWQVEQIRMACRTMGICRTATLEGFRLAGRRLVETPTGELIRMEEERAAMRNIPNHAEVWLIERLLEAATGRG